MAHGIEEFTENGNRRRDSYDLVVTWIFDTWKQVAKPVFVIGGFRKCGYIEWVDNHENLHSRLRDTMLNMQTTIMADEYEIDADKDTDDHVNLNVYYQFSCHF